MRRPAGHYGLSLLAVTTCWAAHQTHSLKQSTIETSTTTTTTQSTSTTATSIQSNA